MTNMFDEFPEWVGMPEFVQPQQKPFKTLTVRFETEIDYLDFQQIIQQKITNKTKSIWHPYKSHWGLVKMVYKDAA